MLFFQNLATFMSKSADCSSPIALDFSLLGLSSILKLVFVAIPHIFIQKIHFITSVPPSMYVGGVAIFINNIFMDYDAHRTCMHIRYRQYKIKDKRFSIHPQKYGGQGRRKLMKKRKREWRE